MKTSLVRRRLGVGEIAQDAAEGAIAGLVATGAMSLLSAVLMAAVRRAGVPEREQRRLLPAAPGGEAPTEKLAREATRAATGRDASRREKRVGAEVIHWTFGTVLGVVYGLLAARSRRVSAGRGLAYGAAVFAGASEAALPVLGLSLPPAAYEPAGHAMNLLTHLVYGAALDAATRGLRATVG